MNRTALDGLPWPLATIDFEASSLEWDGYPIEVGIAVWQAADAPILGWSALIRPPLAWREGGHWSRVSAKIHGITQADLQEHGLPVETVAGLVNAFLAPVGTAWCDGGSYDAGWSRALFEAGQSKAGLVLGNWPDLLSQLGDADRLRTHLELVAQPRHRAREDTERLLFGVAAGLYLPRPPVGSLLPPTPH